MRLRLEGNETRQELMDALRHASASHAMAANQHVRKMLLNEADEPLEAQGQPQSFKIGRRVMYEAGEIERFIKAQIGGSDAV